MVVGTWSWFDQVGLGAIGCDWVRLGAIGCDWVRLGAIGSDCGPNFAWLDLVSGTNPCTTRTPWIGHAEFIPQNHSHAQVPDRGRAASPAKSETPSLHEYLSEERARGEELPIPAHPDSLGSSRIHLDLVRSGAIGPDFGLTCACLNLAN